MAEIGFPMAFASRMQSLLAEEWTRFEQVHLLPSPTSIRINPRKSPSKELERIPWTSFGYYLPERPSFTFDPLFHGGAYYVQEASSMLLEQALRQSVDLSRPLLVLDLCAAPGGKSTHLLSLLNDESLLVSNETIRSRATVLAENICKWGNINAVVTNNDPEDFQQLTGLFDVIVIDAPCSGEGLFRKDKDAMKEWSEENAELCSLRQQRIIHQVWPALKQDGVLIYSTCTYNRKENEGNLVSLVNTGKAECVSLNVDPAWGIQEVVTHGMAGYQCYPHKVKGEGFFISVVRKTENEEAINSRTKKFFEFTPKKKTELVRPFFKNEDIIDFINQDELIIALQKTQVDLIGFLSKRLRVIQKGTAVATLKHDKVIPEHSFAMSNEINAKLFPSIKVNESDAIAYLRKDNIHFASDQKGFTLIKYQEVPLGWINHLGNRSNNLYPPNWRIRSGL